jgi:RNA polymerase primary sigma factor
MDVAQARSQREEMDKLLSMLSEREADVIKMRFGLTTDHSYTLSELSKLYGISRERVRQIQAHAIAKLRDTPLNTAMREYV